MTDKFNGTGTQLPKGLRSRGKRAEFRPQFNQEPVQGLEAQIDHEKQDFKEKNPAAAFRSSDFSLSEGRARLARSRRSSQPSGGLEALAAAGFTPAAPAAPDASAFYQFSPAAEQSLPEGAAVPDLGPADGESPVNLKQQSMQALHANPVLDNHYQGLTGDLSAAELKQAAAGSGSQQESVPEAAAASTAVNGDDPDLIPIKPTLSDEEVPNQPGAILRHAREMLGLTQREIALRLKLRVNSISDIENDRLNQPTAAAFARGHIANYARLVNIDPQIVVDLYDRNVEQVKAQMSHSVKRHGRSRYNPTINTAAGDRSRRRSSGSHLKHWVYGIIFAAIAAGLGLNYIYTKEPAPESAEPLVIEGGASGTLNTFNNDAAASAQGGQSAQEGVSGALSADGSAASASAGVSGTLSGGDTAQSGTLSAPDLNTLRAQQQAQALGTNELGEGDLPQTVEVDTTDALVTAAPAAQPAPAPQPEPAPAVKSAASAAPAAPAPVSAEPARQIVDNQQNGTEGSLTITEPAPALSSTLQDVSSRVSVRGRDGLASLNSASVTVKGAVFLRVTDARGKVLASGNYKAGDALRVTGIPPIKVEVTDSSRISVGYMGGTLALPNARQVSFTLPQR